MISASANRRFSTGLAAFLLALVASWGCWSEVEYVEPEKSKMERPASDSPATPPAETEAANSFAAPAAEGESKPLADATPDVEATPPTEPEPATPSESVPFEEWLSTAAPTAQPTPDAEQPATDREPTQTATAPSVGDRYAPTTPTEPTDLPDSIPPASLPVGDRYATPPSEVAAAPPVEATPAPDEESSPAPLPWEVPAETPAEEPPVKPTPEPSEPVDETAIAPPESPDSPTSDDRDATPKPPVEESPIPEPAAEAFSPAESDAPPTDTTLPAIEPINSRYLAWLLGSKWSLWLLSEHAGAPAEERDKFLQECQTVAKALEVQLPEASPASASRPTAAFLETLLSQGRKLGASIGHKHGAGEMALFEAATKSNLPLALADARPDLLPSVVRAVTDAAKRANLSDDLLQPFVTALADSPTPEQVDRAVFELHRNVEASLRASEGKTGAEQLTE